MVGRPSQRVGSPSRRAGSGRESLPRVGWHSQGLKVTPKGLGGTPESLGVVGRLSWRATSGQEAHLEGRE